MSAPRVALVTGGLDRLGAAIAGRLAADGWALALHCRETCAPAEALAAAIARTGVAWHVVRADLTEPQAADDIIAQTIAHFGVPPTALVNSASIIAEGGWDAVTMEELLAFHRVNVAAPVLLIRALVASLEEGTTGSAVNIIDQRITNPPIDQAGYTASKIALGGLTRVLARAFAPRLRVNAVAPGLTIPGDDYGDGQAARLAEAMPLARLPQPVDIAEAVAYLTSAPAVTGQTIFVDGGAALESYAHDFVHMAREP